MAIKIACASFTLGATMVTALMQKEIVVTSNSLTFGGTHSAQQHLLAAYETRVSNLRDHSHQSLLRFRNPQTSEEDRRKILHKAVSHYLVPTSHDRLFDLDIVLFNGLGKPTIIQRKEFDKIRANWVAILMDASIKPCVDTYRMGAPHSAFDLDRVVLACNACVKQTN
jgi:hypothetical protein